MKNLLVYTIALVFIGIGTGCTSMTINRTGAPIQPKMQLNIKPNVTLSQKKVEGKATVKALFKFITWGVSNTAEGVAMNYPHHPFLTLDPATNKAKAGALYDACQKSKSDVLIAPHYYITTKNYFIYKEVTCKIFAYPAKLNSVELIDDKK